MSLESAIVVIMHQSTTVNVFQLGQLSETMFWSTLSGFFVSILASINFSHWSCTFSLSHDHGFKFLLELKKNFIRNDVLA